MPTIKYDSRGSLVFYLSVGEEPPSDAEWGTYLESVEGVAKRHRGAVRCLVFTGGGAPTALQRKRLGEVAKRIKAESAVITASVVARAVVTAIGWFGVDIKSFAPGHADDAYGFLRLDAQERAWAEETLRRLEKELRAGL